ncbi:MAG: hypothetical protein Kow0037_08420 [Calditrichia bacterium]
MSKKSSTFFKITIGIITFFVLMPLAVNSVLPNSISLSFLNPLVYTDEAKYRVIAAPELSELRLTGKVMIWDVRSPEEYKTEHIPGAVHVDFADLLRGRWPVAPQEVTSIVICGVGEDIPAMGDWATVIGKHYDCEIGVLFGGYSEWLNWGFPVEGALE